MVGFSPREVDEMTFWEFAAAVSGWTKANCPEPEKPTALSEEEHDALMAKY